jgi:hypothetical protein
MTADRISYQPPFGLRLPPDLKATVAAAARANKRSMNAEITYQLERAYTSNEKSEASA